MKSRWSCPTRCCPGTRSTEARWTRWQCPQGANKLATSLRFNPVWATASIKRLLPNETHIGATAARPEQDDLVSLRLAALHAGGADRHAGHRKAGCVRLVGKKTLERERLEHVLRSHSPILPPCGRPRDRPERRALSSPHRGLWFPGPWSEIRLSADAAPSPDSSRNSGPCGPLRPAPRRPIAFQTGSIEAAPASKHATGASASDRTLAWRTSSAGNCSAHQHG